MANDPKSVRMALARALANHTISDDVIDIAADQIASIQHPIRGLDVCAYGICIDFFLEDQEWWRILPELIDVKGGRLTGIEIFPWGIINPDLLHVRVTQSLDVMPQVRG
jgi:hypothetical protein